MKPVPTERDRWPYAIALRVLAGAVLVIVMLGADGYAMAVDGAGIAAAQEPTDSTEEEQPEEEPEEEPPPEDAPAPEDTEEPASEPGDVPLAVWVGAVAFLAVAVGLAVWQTTKNSSSDLQSL
jgi:hypothetical protein